MRLDDALTGPVAPRRRLGAAYLGGTPLRDEVAAYGVDEHRPGAVDEADAVLRTLDAPWCSTSF